MLQDAHAPCGAAFLQVDTQLVGVRCARVLVQLLAAGQLQLSTGAGRPGLLLYTGERHTSMVASVSRLSRVAGWSGCS